MKRKVFISWDPGRPIPAELEAVLRFLAENHCSLQFPPYEPWELYQTEELAIEGCDVFVAVNDLLWEGSTQHGIYLDYALGLKRLRRDPRPQVFLIFLDDHPLARSYEKRTGEFEILLREDLRPLLSDPGP